MAFSNFSKTDHRSLMVAYILTSTITRCGPGISLVFADGAAAQQDTGGRSTGGGNQIHPKRWRNHHTYTHHQQHRRTNNNNHDHGDHPDSLWNAQDRDTGATGVWSHCEWEQQDKVSGDERVSADVCNERPFRGVCVQRWGRQDETSPQVYHLQVYRRSALQWNGTGTGTTNGTVTIGDSGSSSFPCFRPVWTFLYIRTH